MFEPDYLRFAMEGGTPVAIVADDGKFLPRDVYQGVDGAKLPSSQFSPVGSDMIWVTQRGVLSSSELQTAFHFELETKTVRYPSWHKSHVERADSFKRLGSHTAYMTWPPLEAKYIAEFDGYLDVLKSRALTAEEIQRVHGMIMHLRTVRDLAYTDPPIDLGVKVMRQHMVKQLGLPRGACDDDIIGLVYDNRDYAHYHKEPPHNAAVRAIVLYNNALLLRAERLLGPRYEVDFSKILKHYRPS